MSNESDTQHAILVARFLLWARSLKDCQGIPFVTPEIRTWIEAADEEIMDLYAQANERRKADKKMRRRNSENGKLGGRPPTDNPTPSTIRSRKSRARKAKGRE